MNARELHVNTWAELMDALYFDSWSPGLERHRSSYVYRGVQDRTYNLSTTLNRLGESHLEKHLLRNFIKYSHRHERSRSTWNWLALAQHHGLPTRLLDWTYSPLVALHFATSDFNSFGKDGAIWAINYSDTREYLPDQLKLAISEEGSHIFTAEILEKVVDELPKLEKLRPESYALFFEPPSLDERIVTQHAVFSMMSDPNTLINDWLEGKKIRYFKIIIPSGLKWEIRDKLDQSNIHERVLFPGLDGLAKWLKRHYIDIRGTRPWLSELNRDEETPKKEAPPVSRPNISFNPGKN